MFCTDSCHRQPLGEVLHSVEKCFVTSLLKSCVGLNIENMVSDMAIMLKFNILHGRISETDKDILVEFSFVLH